MVCFGADGLKIVERYITLPPIGALIATDLDPLSRVPGEGSYCLPLKPHLWRFCVTYQPVLADFEAGFSNIAQSRLGAHVGYAA